MKKSTYVYGYGRVDVGDHIEFNVKMDDHETGIASSMKVEVAVTKIENDDTIHFSKGSGIIKLREKGLISNVRATILDAVGEI